MQAPWPVEPWYAPAAQLAHVDWPDKPWNFPLPQKEQMLTLPEEYVPAGQERQADAPVVRLEYKPGVQVKHAVEEEAPT